MLVRRIRNRGANIVVEANGEVLFAPQGVVGRWTNRFSQRIGAAVRAEAPVNKRPRWGHYGKPLKSTITASTTYQPGRMKVYAAVGSSAPHAYYVDQGTGVYAGNGPYEAKVLPPWTRGSPSLYEHTWRPGGVGTRKVKPVMIKGQRGQFFFDKGLKRGFQSMRMRSFQVPGEGQITQALSSLPTGMLDFLGNTPADAAFRASLAEWRAWRDEAFGKGKRLGKSGAGSAPARAKAKKAAAAKHKKHGLPAKQQKALDKAINDKPASDKGGRGVKNAAALAAFKRQNPNVKIKGTIPAGVVVIAPRDGKPYIIPWTRLYALL